MEYTVNSRTNFLNNSCNDLLKVSILNIQSSRRSNRTRNFHNTAITETGISDHHKFMTSFFRSHFERIPAKKVEYRNYKKFNVTNFLRDLDQETIQGEMYKYNNNMYSTFSDVSDQC